MGIDKLSNCYINPDIGDRLENCDEDPQFITEPCKTLARSLVDCADKPIAPGCDNWLDGTSRFRGIVAATAVPNNSNIPSGAVLFTCEFEVLDEGALPVELVCGGEVASDPFGTRLEAECGSGMILPAPVPGNTPVPVPCIGDCNGDGAVSVDEIIRMVSISLGTSDTAACTAGDIDGDCQITVDEIVAAVERLLKGC